MHLSAFLNQQLPIRPKTILDVVKHSGHLHLFDSKNLNSFNHSQSNIIVFNHHLANEKHVSIATDRVCMFTILILDVTDRSFLEFSSFFGISTFMKIYKKHFRKLFYTFDSFHNLCFIRTVLISLMISREIEHTIALSIFQF